MNNGSAPKSRRAGTLAVVGLTLCWPVSSLALLWLTFAVAFSGNWKSHDPTRDIATKVLFVATLGMFVLGPLFIAGIAYKFGLRQTAASYAVVSGLLLVGTVLQFTWSPL